MKHIILFLILFSVFNTSKAQLNLRHVQGLSYSGVNIGFVPDGLSFGIKYGMYLRNNMGLEVNLKHEHGLAGLTKYNFLYLSPQYFYTLGNHRNWFFYNVKGGLILGHETIRNEIVMMKRSNFLYGLTAGVKGEIYFSNRLKLDINLNPRYIPNRQTGAFDFFSSIGLAYNF